MMYPVTLRMAVLSLLLLFTVSNFAQPINEPFNKIEKPYRILTSGKQVTVRSTKNMRSIMVWTASGHRIVEQRGINTSNYSFTVRVKEKIVYLMIQYDGVKPYTEKIGLQ